MTTITSDRREALIRELLLRDLKKTAQPLPQAVTEGLAPIPRADRQGDLPLSWAQQRLWFLEQLDPAASAAYHMPAALRLHGRLDVTALQAALDHIVARHEVLRTRFASQRADGSPGPVQRIVPADGGFHLIRQDLQGLPEREQRALVARIQHEVSTRPFDLTTGPLIRGQLLQLADDQHLLVFNQHHIIGDGWSVGLLINEVAALYPAFLAGRTDPLPPLPVQYADYAAWQRQRLNAGALQRQLDFWREELAGAPVLLPLPADHPRPAMQSHAGAALPLTLPAPLTAALQALSQRHGTTLFMTLLAGWSLLLARLSGQREVVVGTPVANRQRAELESLIGFFVNTLALRIRVNPNDDVAALLQQVKARTLAAYAQQDVPFEQVVEALKPARSLSHSPVFQVMLVLDNTPPRQTLALPGLELEAVELPRPTTQFDLSLELTHHEGTLSGRLEYATALFEAATIERLAGHLQTLLAAMAADDSCRLHALPLLTTAERRQLLTDWNNTARPYPEEGLLHRLFEARADARPEAVALVHEDQALSYGELNRQANRIAHRLLDLGLGPDDRVALCAERGPELIAGLLGILKAGGAYVPLAPSDPPERLAWLLRDCAPAAVLTQAALRTRLPATAPMICLDRDVSLAERPDTNPDPASLGLKPRHLAYLIYTSGSTGEPKGVMVEHTQVSHYLHNAIDAYGLSPSDRLLQVSAISFDASVEEIFGALCSGAALVLRPATLPADRASFDALCTQQQITVLGLPTAYWQRLLTESEAPWPAGVRLTIVGGEAMTPQACAAWQQRGHGRLVNTYGPTETTVVATRFFVDGQPAATVPIGRPIANTRVYLLDDHLQPVPIGVAGEVYLGGAGVARGYWNRPSLTEERFLPDPFGDPQASGPSRLYRTGDLARWRPDGNLEFLGRNDFQLKWRGYRIEPAEIESRLAACPGVREALVVAREDTPNDKRLVAYVVGEDGFDLNTAALRVRLAESLPEYLIPVAWVVLDALPLNRNGKVDRHALPAPAGGAWLKRGYAPPEGPVEQAIAAVWQALLGVAPIGRHDHFFELGGHSLLVVSCIERLRRQGISLVARNVFATPTLAALAATVDAAKADTLSVPVPPNLIPAGAERITPEQLPLVALPQEAIDNITAAVPGGAANIQDLYPLAPLQEGILFHHLLAAAGDPYLTRSVLAFDSRGRLDAFIEALQAVIRRHDILRTAVFWEGLPRAVQVVLREAPLQVQVLPADRLGTHPRQLRLDLARAPLLAAYAAPDPASGEWRLVLLTHHLICDHLSLENVLAEIRQRLSGTAEPPPAQPYRNFIAQTLGVPAERHEAWFRTQLAEVSEPTAPFGLMDVQGDGDRVDEARLPLPEPLARHIRAAATRYGTSPAVLFHAAWALVTGRCCDRDDVVFGTVLLGRLQGMEGADQALGMFMNTLPLRIPLAGGAEQLVATTHQRLNGLLQHEHASLVLAQRCSGVPAPAPLFTTLLNYRHSRRGTASDRLLIAEGIRALAGEERCNYPIGVSIDDFGADFALTVQCTRSDDPADLAARLAGYLHTAITSLVEALTRHPEQPAVTLAILPEPEQRQLLLDWNTPAKPLPDPATAELPFAHQLFEAQAAARPDAPALVDDHHRLSYGELNRRANQLAHQLLDLGVQPDDRIAICVDRGFDMIAAVLAVLKAGGAYVPLDPVYPAERLAWMLRDSTPVALLTQSGLAARLPEHRLPVLLLDDAAATQAKFAAQPAANPDPATLGLEPGHLAYLIYTSGSTGQPKGVMNHHAGLANLARAQIACFDVRPHSHVLQWASFSFDASVSEIMMALGSGASLHLATRDDLQPGEALLATLQRHAITHVTAPPLVLVSLPPEAFAPMTVIVAGEACPAETARQWARHHRLINAYGPTETTVCATAHRCAADEPGPPPIGRPIANVQVYVLDAQRQLVPAGAAGELYVGGVGVARGYLNQPELTAERFVTVSLPELGACRTWARRAAKSGGAAVFSPDLRCVVPLRVSNPSKNRLAPPLSRLRRPKSDRLLGACRLYKTGDLVRFRPDGTLEYLGRNDFQVKIRGVRIELGEIETRLRACPGVRDAAVLARSGHDGEKRLVAYLVPEAGRRLPIGELRARLAAVLAEPMVPAAYVVLDAFPLNPNGKLDRRALPAPAGDAYVKPAYAPPVGEIETTLAGIWTDLLDIAPIGRHDHFFALGGHSLLAVQLLSRLRQALGVAFALREVFAAPVLHDMAEAVSRAKVAPAPPIRPADRRQPLPLSFAQQRLWLLDRLDPAAGAAYHLPVALRLQGRLDLAALQATLDRVVARHEILRTTFEKPADGDQPVQVIAPPDGGFALERLDLRALPPDEQQAAVTRLGLAEAARPFDLARGPLIRGRLLQTADDCWVLLFTQHHIVSDGWSLGLLVNEVAALYGAFGRGEPAGLPELPLHYADYAAWQRDWLHGEALAVQLDFWRRQLSGAPAVITLPTDRPRPAVHSYAGATLPLALPAPLTAGLQALAQRHGATLFMALLAGWATLLARLSGQPEVVIGTPVANRQHTAFEGLIGFFVNTLALRIPVAPDLNTGDLLDQIKRRTLSAYAHQDVPFEQVVEALQPARSLSHSPVFQVMLSLDNTPGNGPLALPGLELSPLDLPYASTAFDLSLALTERDGTVSGVLTYATALWDPSTIERHAGHFLTLLQAMVDDDAAPLHALPLLSEPERRQLLVDWNDTARPFPRQQLVHQLFEAVVLANPEAVAVVGPDDTLSYGCLDAAADRLAAVLQSLGVRPGSYVPLLLERSSALVAAELAILKCGAAYVPLDPHAPPERLAFQIADCRAAVVLSISDLELPEVAGVRRLDLDAALPHAGPRQPVQLGSESPAYVMYTSGSTGEPKGVVVPHRAVIAHLVNSNYAEFGPADRVAFASNPAFDSSTLEIWAPLLHGGSIVVIPPEAVLDPEALARRLHDTGTTFLILVAGLLTAYADTIATRFPKLRTLLTGGDVADPRAIAKVLRHNPPDHLLQTYGPTEATQFATTCDIRAIPDATAPLPIGRPTANTRVYLLDDTRQPVPIGVTGELYIGGEGVALGYLNRPALTAERFVDDPFRPAPGARLYRTGDLARWRPDGTLDFLGRNDFQVKIRGFRIELGEIETRLAACAGVREAIVLARDDAPGEKRLVAYFTTETGAPPEPADLQTQLAAVLPDYMVPATFVRLDRWPLTPNGKVDRQALPAPDDAASAPAFEPPAGPIETAIAEIWQELLHHSPISRHDHFFALGGHSLLVVSFIDRLRRRGLHIDVRAIFATPTLAALAAGIPPHPAATPAVPPNPIPPEGVDHLTPALLPLVALTPAEVDRVVATVAGGARNVQDVYPLAPLQEGILFHHLLADQGDVYLSRSTLAFDTRDRLDTFLAALQTVIGRHDILRTAVVWDGLAQPVQVVWRQARLPVQELPPDPATRALDPLLAASDPGRVRLDLNHAPLLAAWVTPDPATGEWLLALLNHHLVSDHLSHELILGEIGRLLQGEADVLPPPLPYRDYIARTRGSAAEHEAWFRAQLGDIDEPTAPFGVLHVQGQDAVIAEARLTLDATLCARLREAARQQGVSPAVLFHAAWALVLAHCCGRTADDAQDVVFGTVLLGRLQAAEGAGRVPGMFMNTLPLRIPLAARGAAEVVAGTWQRLAGLLEHEHASLALAQRCSGVEAPLPLFTALLNYRHGPHEDPAETSAAWTGIRRLGAAARSSFPLLLAIDDQASFGLTVQAVPPIDPGRVAGYVQTALASLVSALEADPARPALALDILPDAERRQLLVPPEANRVEFGGEPLIHRLFEAQAAAQPDAPAVVYESESLTYGALNRRANHLAHALLALGVRPDYRVALCTERSVDLVVGLLAVLKAGGAYVPLDPAYPAERLAALLADAAPVALLTQTALQGLLPAGDLPTLLLDAADTAAGQPDDNPAVPGLTPQHLAYVIYTSGSTGTANGVMVEHHSAVNFWQALRRTTHASCPPLARIGLNASFAFDMSLKGLLQLLSGDCVVLIPQAIRADGDALLRFLAQQQIDAFDVTPSQLDGLLAAGLLENTGYAPKSVLIGGEAIAPATWDRLRRSTIRFFNMYGPTECTIDATIGQVNGDLPHPHLGKPIPNCAVYLLDARRQPVPLGVPGEIHIAGAGVARGYLNRPALTAQRFLEDPFTTLPAGRMYKTGDLARLRPDGTLEYLGRNDFQVKIRGFRVELGEIEAALRACPGVADVVVIARKDLGAGPKDPRLVAYLVPAPGEAGTTPDSAGLRERLARTLPEPMLPAAYVLLDRLPLNQNGKLDRRALPAPDAAAFAAQRYEAPVGETETALAGLWQDLLGVPQVGRHDQFFALGGHSLLAVQLISRLRQLLGVDLPLREVFAQPSLQAMARAVSTAGAAAAELPPILPADRSRPLPLSWAQQRLWFLTRLDPAAGAAYQLPAALRLQGRLDHAALQATLDRVVARHEVLRTRFPAPDGEPVQCIAPPDAGFALACDDLRELPAEARQAAVAQWQEEELRQPFDLATGPLIRGRLLRLADDEHLLLFTRHHIISDGWSIGRLVDEVVALYPALRRGEPDPLPPLPVQYADYAAWQRQWLQGEVLQAQLDFWRRHLADAPPLLPLPADHPRPPVQRYGGDTVRLELPAGLTARLKTLARRHGCTLFMVLFAGWATLLARLSHQPDVVIGTPVANRRRAELEPLIGFFVNTLPLRLKVDLDQSVGGLLQQARTLTLDAYSHQDVPFEQIVEALQPARSLSHNPLFQVLLTLNNTPAGAELALPDLTLSPQPLPFTSTQVDLSLSLAETGDTLSGVLGYATALFERATIERLAGQLQTLLAALAADDRQALHQLPLLSPAERRQLLIDWNHTSVAYPRGELVHPLFETQAAARPEAVALHFEDATLSYGELNRLANQLAHQLLCLGVRPDDRVAISAERGFPLVIGLLAILKAGGAYVPLDPGYPAERLAFMLADSTPKVLLATQAVAPRLPAAEVPTLLIDSAELHTQLAGQPATNPEPATLGLGGHHLAYVIYTSGSTGRPKGAMNEHRGMVNRLRWAQDTFALAPADRVLQKTPFGFDVSVWEFFLPLLAGAELVLARPGGQQDPGYLAEVTAGMGITTLHFVPSMLQAFLDQKVLPPLPRLRQILCSGEALPWALQQRCLERLPQAALHNLYGPTEAAVDVSHWRCDPALHPGRVPIGRPIANTRLYVLDPYHQPVPVGVSGELYIGGVQVGRGYLNQPALTAERFLRDPFSSDPDARLYRTGDLVRWLPDGALDYFGRNDFQLKIRGLRVELGEIEARLRACPGVREAVVVAHPAGEGALAEPRLVAYLTLTADTAPQPADLRAQLARSLPEYMIPAAFVVLDALPLSPNGKLDRRALPAPDGAVAATRDYEPPQGAIEQVLARLWQTLLGVPQVGRNDHFFELGGHSLLAVQLVTRIRDQLYLELPLQAVFEHPVLTDLADQVATAQLAQLARFDGIGAAELQVLEQELDGLSESELLAIVQEDEAGRRGPSTVGSRHG